MNSRDIALNKVNKFNLRNEIGTEVYYLKSDIEGKTLSRVISKAYVQGDENAMVVLDGIGSALLDKIEIKY